MCRPLPLLMLFAFGCAPEPAPPPRAPAPEPMAITGPNEVIVLIPSMVCESCSQKIADGLALLYWVEPGTLSTDRKLRQVRFRVTGRERYDFEELKESMSKKGFTGIQVLVGPT